MSEPFIYKNPVAVKHPKVRMQVIEYLLHQILSQGIRVNEPLPNANDLCESLGVSRTVVREAISILVSKGMVSSKPGEGSVVEPLSSWMLLDTEVLSWLRESDMATAIIEHLIEFRLTIEPEAAALAAMRGTMEQFMALSEAFHRMSVEDSGRTQESVQGDIDFHNIILDAAGNIFISRLKDLCSISVELVIRLTYGRVESLTDSLDNHRRLFEAIRARQPELARIEARRVLSKTVYDLLSINIPFRQDILQQLKDWNLDAV